jgi:hypothetical protein
MERVVFALHFALSDALRPVIWAVGQDSIPVIENLKALLVSVQLIRGKLI